MHISQQEKLRRRRPPRFELIAGAVCLDFVNTLDDRFTDHPKELLTSYVDFARFGEDEGILEPTEVDHLFELSQTARQAAQRALEAAIQLREALFEVFWAIVKEKPAPATSLIVMNRYVQDAAQHSSLVQTNGAFDWRFDSAPNNLEKPLWPIARSAADLLSSGQSRFIRACAAENCQWLFLDVSKNHRRRWCDMTKCGNRAKARQFYARQKRVRA